MSVSKNVPVKTFRSGKAFETWLEKHHEASQGVWLRLFKKDSGKKGISNAEALDVALCYGWIDGQKLSHDEVSWLQKFVPRRKKSNWSKINTGHVARLSRAGRMKAAGLKAVEEAKADGRWAKAYDPPSKMTVPRDFLDALGKNKKAAAFYKGLNKTNLFSIAFRLLTAKKPETRERRMKQIIAMLARGEKFY